MCRGYFYVEDYADVSPCFELNATYDDHLKKDNVFCRYAVLVANRVIEDLRIENLKATWGKWGARIETDKNKKYTKSELEDFAYKIVNHPCWQALKLSTNVFTFGYRNPE